MTVVITEPGPSTVISNADTGETVITTTAGPSTVISTAAQPGLTGPAGGSVTVHPVTVPASTWTVTHTLGRYPLVQLIDAAGAEFDGDVEMPDLATVVVTHAQPITGSVLLS